MTAKATEKGIAELGNEVLGTHFQLSEKENGGEDGTRPYYSVRLNLPSDHEIRRS